MRDLVVGEEGPSQVVGGMPSSTLVGSKAHIILLSLAIVLWQGNCTKTYKDAAWDYPILHTVCGHVSRAECVSPKT